MKNCQQCGKQIIEASTKTGSEQKYCTPICRNLAWRTKNRQKTQQRTCTLCKEREISGNTWTIGHHPPLPKKPCKECYTKIAILYY